MSSGSARRSLTAQDYCPLTTNGTVVPSVSQPRRLGRLLSPDRDADRLTPSSLVVWLIFSLSFLSIPSLTHAQYESGVADYSTSHSAVVILATLTPTNTPTATPTNTPTNTPTVTPTVTPMNTQTNTPTNTPTETPTGTPTDSPTNTPNQPATATPIATGTATSLPTVGSVSEDSISGIIRGQNGESLGEPLVVYLEQVGEQRVLSARLNSTSVQAAASASFYIRSTQTDESGYFVFTGLPKGYSYTVQPRLEGYAFSPSELTLTGGSFMAITAVAGEPEKLAACVRFNRVKNIVNSDYQSWMLRNYLFDTLDTFERSLARHLPAGVRRQRIEIALAASRQGIGRAHAQLMRESFNLPSVTYRCDPSNSPCSGGSYRDVVHRYRVYLLALRLSGLFDNRIVSPITSDLPSSRNAVARQIKKLHSRALRASRKLPQRLIRCNKG